MTTIDAMSLYSCVPWLCCLNSLSSANFHSSQTRNFILDLSLKYLLLTFFLWQIFNPIKKKVEIWVPSVLQLKIWTHLCTRTSPGEGDARPHKLETQLYSLWMLGQVSLLYGGILEWVFSSSLLRWSVSRAGELKSLVSPPAGQSRKKSVKGLLTAKNNPDLRLVWYQGLNFSPCQVHTISVSLGSDCGTSVSCHINKTFWTEPSLLAQDSLLEEKAQWRR